MKTTLLRLSDRMEFGPRISIAVLLLIMLVVGLCSALHAVVKPLWFDEICTVILCRLPSASDIWKALADAADTNPPPFYLVARLSRHLVSDDHLGYRLPSILGLLGTVFCIYLILAKRVDRLSALVGVTFVLCTSVATYAYEARPYALMLGCISGAILAWQRIDESRLYSLVVALTLAAAVSLHYYAILVWPALLMAELSVWIFHRRFRISAWSALLIGALPLLVYLPLLLSVRQYYGQHFWATTSISQAFLAYDVLFTFGLHWGVVFAGCITAIFLFVSITKTERSCGSGYREAEVNVLPIQEQTLTLMLLWLPVIAVVLGKVAHSGMAERYMLPAVLGGALALGCVVDKMPSAGRVLLLIFLLVQYISSTVLDPLSAHSEIAGLEARTGPPQPAKEATSEHDKHDVGQTRQFADVRELLNGSLPRASAIREVKTIVAQSDLPIVISSGKRYLPMAYYASTDSNGKLFAVADPREAVIGVKTDSIDLALLVLRRYFPLQVEDYVGFMSSHHEFLLVVGGAFEWLPARLVQDGYNLRLVSTEGTTVYKVTAP